MSLFISNSITFKQIQFLKSIGYNGNFDITKQEAGKLIDDYFSQYNDNSQYSDYTTGE